VDSSVALEMNEPGRQTGLILKRSRLLGERPVALEAAAPHCATPNSR
jgi:hypothetical protein